MGDDLSTLAFTAASAAVVTKKRGVAIIGFRIPAAVDNVAVRLGLELSFDGGTTYSVLATDKSGTATPFKPTWAVGQIIAFDPIIIYPTQMARNVRVTLYKADGTTVAIQTSTSLGVVYAKITRE